MTVECDTRSGTHGQAQGVCNALVFFTLSSIFGQSYTSILTFGSWNRAVTANSRNTTPPINVTGEGEGQGQREGEGEGRGEEEEEGEGRERRGGG